MLEMQCQELIDGKTKQRVGYRLAVEGVATSNSLERAEDVLISDFLEIGHKMLARRLKERDAAQERRGALKLVPAPMGPKDPEGAA